MSGSNLFCSYLLYLIPPFFIGALMTLLSPNLTICTDLKAPFLIDDRRDLKKIIHHKVLENQKDLRESFVVVTVTSL